MKKTLALLGVVACGLGVSSLQASPDVTSANTVAKSKYPSKKRYATVYITSVPAVGSHLPLVVRRYHGSVDCMSPTVAYSAPQLDQTGQLTVQGQLQGRDPAFSGFGLARR
ncbi:MAG: hypothetical protein INR62_13695 [Rhodospirillales bacterium]|nr:hypothetical protein [Acetobacter sp.]